MKLGFDDALADHILDHQDVVVLLLRTEVAGAYREIVAALSSGRGLPPFLLQLPLVGGWLQELNARMVGDPEALRETLQSIFNSSYGRISDVLGDVGRNIAKLFIRSSVCSFSIVTAIGWRSRLGRAEKDSRARMTIWMLPDRPSRRC
jgi:hypothetical protein